jgi:hypothetical protein
MPATRSKKTPDKPDTGSGVANPNPPKMQRHQKNMPPAPPKRPEEDIGETPKPPDKAKTPRRQNRSGVVIPRDPLPDRRGRNIHPAGPVITRRTPQEVAAQRSAERQAIEEKIREGERAKELLAQINVDEEFHDIQMLTDNPQRLSVALRKHGRDDQESNESEDEGFHLGAVEGDSDVDDATVEPIKGKVMSYSTFTINMSTDQRLHLLSQMKKPKKAAKGVLRDELQVKERKVRGSNKQLKVRAEAAADLDVMFVYHMFLQFSTSNNPSVHRNTEVDTIPRTYSNAGLRKNRKPKKTPEVIDPLQNGGFGEEHLLSVRPPFPTSKAIFTASTGFPAKLQRDLSRKNTVRMTVRVPFKYLVSSALAMF